MLMRLMHREVLGLIQVGGRRDELRHRFAHVEGGHEAVLCKGLVSLAQLHRLLHVVGLDLLLDPTITILLDNLQDSIDWKRDAALTHIKSLLINLSSLVFVIVLNVVDQESREDATDLANKQDSNTHVFFLRLTPEVCVDEVKQYTFIYVNWLVDHKSFDFVFVAHLVAIQWDVVDKHFIKISGNHELLAFFNQSCTRDGAGHTQVELATQSDFVYLVSVDIERTILEEAEHVIERGDQVHHDRD